MTFKDFNFCPHVDYADIGDYFCDCMSLILFNGVKPLKFSVNDKKKLIEDLKKNIGFKKKYNFWQNCEELGSYDSFYDYTNKLNKEPFMRQRHPFQNFKNVCLSSRIKHFSKYEGDINDLEVSEFYYKYKHFEKTINATNKYTHEIYRIYKRIADTYENTEYHKQIMRYSKKLL